VTTAINEFQKVTNISVFPNPVDETLNIHFTDNKKYFLSIYNAFGENVYSTETTIHLQLQTTSFGNGIYFIKASSESNICYRIVVSIR